MARIAIVTGSHLCNNPRVPKEADALAAAGHEVAVLGPVLEPDLRDLDAGLLEGRRWRFRACVDLTRGGVSSVLARARRKGAALLVRRLGVQSPGSLGYGLGSLLDAAREEDADLVIGHEEAGLWVAARLLREGRKASVDVEDWYSRDLLPEARRDRPIALLESLEAECVARCASVTAPSRAMASALGELHGRKDIAVVYNAFPPWEPPGGPDAAVREPGPPSLLWFSQTVGPGRGLERLFLALDRLEFPVALSLTGDCREATRAALEEAFPRARGHRLGFVPRVPPGDLAAHIARHDAGLALEEERPESRDATLTNKVLQCLASGIPVVATPTRGQREAGALTPAVRVAASFGPADLAAAMRGLLASAGSLEEGKRQAREAARGPLSWERSARVLVETVESALAAGGRP